MGNGASARSRPHTSPQQPVFQKSTRTLRTQKSKASFQHIEEKSPASSIQDTLPNEQLPLAYAPPRLDVTDQDDETTRAYASFLTAYPEYQLTWILDTFRRTDFARLDRTGETYVDYMGGSIYPESLVRVHTEFLTRSVLGNTHSVSNRYEFSCCSKFFI
jgi:molybdenum cofactor sulfurtransferase